MPPADPFVLGMIVGVLLGFVLTILGFFMGFFIAMRVVASAAKREIHDAAR